MCGQNYNPTSRPARRFNQKRDDGRGGMYGPRPHGLFLIEGLAAGGSNRCGYGFLSRGMMCFHRRGPVTFDQDRSNHPRRRITHAMVCAARIEIATEPTPLPSAPPQSNQTEQPPQMTTQQILAHPVAANIAFLGASHPKVRAGRRGHRVSTTAPLRRVVARGKSPNCSGERKKEGVDGACPTATQNAGSPCGAARATFHGPQNVLTPCCGGPALGACYRLSKC